ncbi:EF-hand domain-containing protein [Actinophytocola sp.]|uniref:EF-hand domain-containing protein n=1 Tax=Actinophytocola sp. TaxID=1872138 RepID=UPI002ED1FEFB
MLTTEQQRLIEDEFKTLDTNGDGRVTTEDYVLLADRVCAKFGHAPGSPIHQKLTTALKTWGRQLLEESDTDKNDAISREEYVATLQRRTAEDPTAFQRNKPVVDALWELMDTDKDGTISRDEYKKVQKAFGLSDKVIDETFQRMDKDRDNVVSRDEATAFLSSWGARN